MKNQNECVKGQSVSFHDGNVSNYEIMSNEIVSMSNENMSMSNQYESNQDKSESSVCNSHYDASAISLDESGKFQFGAKKPETTLHTRPVREEKMSIRFNDYELS